MPETAYDRSLDRTSRKARGAYYTPAALVDYMVERTVGRLLERCVSVDDLLHLKIYDPACGTGVFLNAVLILLCRWVKKISGSVSEDLRCEIQRRCLFGADIDARALEIARALLPSANLVHGNALTSSRLSERFDAVIGNPPYGIDTGLNGNSTRLFISNVLQRLAPTGLHAFVVPKTILYSSIWRETLEELMPGLVEIVDCGKAWPEVKLEQVIYFFEGPALKRTRLYRSCLHEGGAIKCLTEIEKSGLAEFGFALNGVTQDELSLGRKIRSAGSFLGEHVTNRRGARLQSQLAGSGRGRVPVYGGKQIGRYGLSDDPKGFISARVALEGGGQARMVKGAILAQNIVAHVTRPRPHLKIIATVVPDIVDGFILDTVNQLQCLGPNSSEFFLGVLNSRLISWYVYRFIVGRAVRTIHLDSPVTARIPIPARIDKQLHDEIAGLAREMLLRPTAAVDAEIDRLVCLLFGLEKGEARAGGFSGFGGSGIRGFLLSPFVLLKYSISSLMPGHIHAELLR